MWNALAVLFLTKLVESFAQGLGDRLAGELHGAITGAKRQDGDYERLLNRLTAEFVAKVKIIVDENEIRRERANLASVLSQFEGYLASPRQRRDDLGRVAGNADTVFRQLASLPAAAAPALITATGLTMAVQFERFRVAKSRSTAIYLYNYCSNVSTTLVNKIRGEVALVYANRVSSPYDGDQYDIWCRVFDSIEGGRDRFAALVRSAAIDSDGGGQAEVDEDVFREIDEISSVEGQSQWLVRHEPRSVTAYSVRVDGQIIYRPKQNCEGVTDQESVDFINNLSRTERDRVNREYQSDYGVPLDEFVQKRDALLEKIRPYVRR